MGENDDFKVLCNGFRSPVGAVRRRALVDLGIYIARLPLHGCDSRTRRMYRNLGSKASHQGLCDFCGLIKSYGIAIYSSSTDSHQSGQNLSYDTLDFKNLKIRIVSALEHSER